MSRELDELEATLEQHLRFVRERARAASAWGEVVQFYGLDPGAHAGGFGAVSADQLRAAVQAVVLRAARYLETLERAGADPARVEALWSRLGALAQTECTAHAGGGAAPKRDLGLGSIFKNATASVGQHPWDGLTYETTLTLICKTCGAAQRKSRDFRCAYCRGDLFRRKGDDREETG